MPGWNNDTELFDLLKRELFSAVVGDVMDDIDLFHQFLPRQIQPLRDDMIVIGRAMPVQEADYGDKAPFEKGRDKPFGLMFKALDDLNEGEVYITSGASPTYALWGELMSVCAMKRKAVGAVVNGVSRDTNGILKLNFPTFSTGRYAQDQGVRGRVIDFRCRIEFPNGVEVSPGDIVFGDIDGVVIIPQEHEEDVVNRALEKVRGENMVRKSIEEGMPSQEAFDTYGIM